MKKIIVSLTTYPARICGITRVLDSIMAQIYKPDKVVLYLSEEQLPEREPSVDLSAYFEQGLEIHWCQGDMKSHKKYLYAFRDYPDDYIITIDDDIYYEPHMVEELVQYIQKFPKCILARRTHLITADRGGNISEYGKWWHECIHCIGEPRMDLCATGCGGILYPPNIFTKEVFNADNIKAYAMYADDMWLKVMELISGIPVVQVPTLYRDILHEEYAMEGLYQKYNGDGGNDRQFCKLLDIYGHFGGMKESLTEIIFSTGIVYADEVSKGKKNDNFKMAEEWIGKICEKNKIVIYGAGTVAKRIYNLLKRHEADEKIKFFAVGDTDKNVSAIGNIDVVQYKSIDYAGSVCVIGLADLAEQVRVKKLLLERGLAESQIFCLNSRLQRALCDYEEG